MYYKFSGIMFGKTSVETVDAAESQGINSGENRHVLKGLRIVVLIGRLLGVFSRTDLFSEHEQNR